MQTTEKPTKLYKGDKDRDAETSNKLKNSYMKKVKKLEHEIIEDNLAALEQAKIVQTQFIDDKRRFNKNRAHELISTFYDKY